jgi:hypothetical protein
MSKKSLPFVTTIVIFATLFLAGGIMASENFPEMIEMNCPAYEQHKKGIVEFSHQKHVDDYGATCGDCHHDDEGNPLTELKVGDDVKRCSECHDKPGLKPRGKDAPKLSREEELQYHAEALHDNCRNCHREYNKANETKAAPTTCSKCHPREK